MSLSVGLVAVALSCVQCGGGQDRGSRPASGPRDDDLTAFTRYSMEAEALFEPGEKEELAGLEADEWRGFHARYGIRVRNELGLWRDSEIHRWFRERGITHPDVMSMLLVWGVQQHFHGQAIDLPAMLRRARVWSGANGRR